MTRNVKGEDKYEGWPVARFAGELVTWNDHLIKLIKSFKDEGEEEHRTIGTVEIVPSDLGLSIYFVLDGEDVSTSFSCPLDENNLKTLKELVEAAIEVAERVKAQEVRDRK